MITTLEAAKNWSILMKKKITEELDSYVPEIIEGLTLRYAKTVLEEKDLDNLSWAKDFIDNYERKHKK